MAIPFDRRAALGRRAGHSFTPSNPFHKGKYKMFDTKTVAKTLVEGGFSEKQAAALMVAIASNTPVQAAAAPAGRLLQELRTPAQIAEDGQNLAQLRQIMAMCRRFGISLAPEKTVDIFALDSALAAAKAPVSERLQLKTMLAAEGMIR
jgi:hypothetical protein